MYRRRTAGEVFLEERFPEILLPKGGVLAVLEAYLDASKSKGRVFSVAGFAFETKHQAKKFGKEFRALFAPYGGVCHMTDLHNREKAFKSLNGRRHDAEVNRLIVEAIKIINERATFGVAVGCDYDEAMEVLPKEIDGLSHPYPFCCHMAMMMLGHLVRRKRPGDEIAYIFECGDERQAEANRFMNRTPEAPTLKRDSAYFSHGFAPKAQSPLLQGADILAWEYSRYWELTVLKRKIDMRKSLVSILTSGHKTMDFKERYALNFFSGPPLWEAVRKMKMVGPLRPTDR